MSADGDSADLFDDREAPRALAAVRYAGAEPVDVERIGEVAHWLSTTPAVGGLVIEGRSADATLAHARALRPSGSGWSPPVCRRAC